MNQFKVIADKGVFLNGKAYKKGEIVTGELKQAHIMTALHFKQIEKIETAEKPEEVNEPTKKADYIEALNALGVEAPEGAKLADLKELFEKTKAEQGEE